MIMGKVPVEIAGYRDVRIWTVNRFTKIAEFKWWSVANDDYRMDDSLPWAGESDVDDCPF